MKPTDFFSNIDLHLKPPCKNGDPCHERAPRGTRKGLQKIKGTVARSIYPTELCDHIVSVCEDYFFNYEQYENTLDRHNVNVLYYKKGI